MSERLLRTLLGVVFVEALLALVVRIEAVRRMLSGDMSVWTISGVAGLAWLVVLIPVVLMAIRSMRAARQRLWVSEHALVDVGGLAADWLWESDTFLRFTYCSRQVSTQLGYRPESLLGQNMLDLVLPEDREIAQHILHTSLQHCHGWRDVELRWRHADGHVITLQGSSEPILDPGGAVIGFRGARRPVTAHVVAERATAVLRDRVTAALAEVALDIAWQPIVDVTRGSLTGVEALARFHDGRGPDAWFTEAGHTGQALDLDRLSFAQALGTLRQLPPSSSYLSINATPELITDPGWQRTLARAPLPLNRMVIEITEHVEIGRYEDIHSSLSPLRARGLRLAVDDTGAGYASFSHVLKLRPDIIKLDRSLIAGLPDDPARRSLVTALALLSLDLEATLTAEGVESLEELRTLAGLGVDHVQGFLLARPTTDPREWASWASRTWSIADPAGTRIYPAGLAHAGIPMPAESTA